MGKDQNKTVIGQCGWYLRAVTIDCPMIEPVRSSSKNLFTLAEDQKYIPVPHNAVTFTGADANLRFFITVWDLFTVLTDWIIVGSR